jgi:putative transposase
MKLRKVYRFRMRPTKAQEASLYRMAGVRRFVYNWALDRRKGYYSEHGKGISARELSSELTALKGQPETHWLKEGDSQMLQQVLRDVDRAFVAFFEKRSRFPRLRSKKAAHFAFRVPQRVGFEDGRVLVPKAGWVRFRQSRQVEGKTKSATFKRDAAGHWYVCLTAEFEMPDTEPPAPVNQVGVELQAQRQDRALLPVHEALLRVRDGQAGPDARGQEVALCLRDSARQGSQRRQEHTRRRNEAARRRTDG